MDTGFINTCTYAGIHDEQQENLFLGCGLGVFVLRPGMISLSLNSVTITFISLI